jgi:hypothetical protein
MHDDDDLPVIDHRPAVDAALDEAVMADQARATIDRGLARAAAQRRLDGIRSSREMVQALQLLAGMCQSTAAVIDGGKWPPPTWLDMIAHRYELVAATGRAWADLHQPGGVR